MSRAARRASGVRSSACTNGAAVDASRAASGGRAMKVRTSRTARWRGMVITSADGKLTAATRPSGGGKSTVRVAAAARSSTHSPPR